VCGERGIRVCGERGISVWRERNTCVWRERNTCVWRKAHVQAYDMYIVQIVFHKRATKYRSLLWKMTYKDKGSYESSPPCSPPCTREEKQRTATLCNTLHHTATHCNTLQRTATHCNTREEKLRVFFRLVFLL